MDATDQMLLREFATRRCETSFRQLVDRHVTMVFAVSKRVTANHALAEEITQASFAQLATKATALGPDTIIAGWLYHTARNQALMAIRSETRRRQREEVAATMNPVNETSDAPLVTEHLESAMDQLPSADRDALVLRFFEDRSLREVGHELGLTEDAARMRVNRALEKLRDIFARLGFTGTAAGLAAMLPASTSAAAPAGLGATISTAVLTGATAVAATALVTETASTTMNLFNLKTVAAILGAAAVTGTTTYFVQERAVSGLQGELKELQTVHAQLASAQEKISDTIQLRDEQIERLKKEVAELPRLRGEVDRLQRETANHAEHQRELDRLREEHRSLKEQVAATTAPEPDTKTATRWNLREPRRLSELEDAGRNTPEAAMQTLLWAATNGQFEKVAEMTHLPANSLDEAQTEGRLLPEAKTQLAAIVLAPAQGMAQLGGEPDGAVWLENGATTRLRQTNQDGSFFEYDQVVSFQLTGSPDPSDKSATRHTSFYFTETSDGWKYVIPGISPEIRRSE